jgi:site-specific recombinase XerD
MMAGSGWGTAFFDWLTLDGRSKGQRPLRPNTVAGYRQDIDHLARWCGDFEPAKLTPDLVHRYFESQSANGDAPKTMNRRLASMRTLVRWAIGAGLLESDPTMRQGRFSEESLPPRAKSADETLALQGVISAGAHLKKQTEKYSFLGMRDHVIWALAAEAGLRESEIAGLKLAGVDFKSRYITVCGKGGHTGHVKVSQKLLDLITTWLQVRPSTGEYLVCDWAGNGLSRSQIWRRIKAIGEAADVEVSPHDLRHGFCLAIMRKALIDGLSPESALDVVRRQARHRDSRTSQMYLRATDGDLERVMEAL